MSQRSYEDRKLYQQKYQRERAARLRAEFMSDKSCARCGSCLRLQLHHKDPKAKAGHKIWSWSRSRREAEISKCEVLCHPCHLWRHWGSKLRPVRIMLEPAFVYRLKKTGLTH